MKRVNTLIERSGGSVERTNLWASASWLRGQASEGGLLRPPGFQFEPSRVPELEAGPEDEPEVLRHLIVRQTRQGGPDPRCAAAGGVVLEPIAMEETVAEPAALGNREEFQNVKPEQGPAYRRLTKDPEMRYTPSGTAVTTSASPPTGGRQVRTVSARSSPTTTTSSPTDRQEEPRRDRRAVHAQGRARLCRGAYQDPVVGRARMDRSGG